MIPPTAMTRFGSAMMGNMIRNTAASRSSDRYRHPTHAHIGWRSRAFNTRVHRTRLCCHRILCQMTNRLALTSLRNKPSPPAHSLHFGYVHRPDRPQPELFTHFLQRAVFRSIVRRR